VGITGKKMKWTGPAKWLTDYQRNVYTTRRKKMTKEQYQNVILLLAVIAWAICLGAGCLIAIGIKLIGG